MTTIRWMAAAAAVLATAWPLAAATVSGSGGDDSVRDREIRQAVGGTRPVVVAGAPPDGAEAAAVAAALRTPAFAQSTSFTAAESVGPEPTLVLIFGARGATSSACRGAPPAGTQSSEMIVTGVLCIQRDAARTATLRGSSVGPSDPAFADEMAELTRVLYRRVRRNKLLD
jgi:hypothetical protein